MSRLRLLAFFVLLTTWRGAPAGAAEAPWYTQGRFAPTQRIELTLTNPLLFDRTDCPITIRREQMPVQDLQEMWITIVDPALTPRPEPTPEERRKGGAHQIRGEADGRMIYHQLDDLDKDGVWDELFFITDIKANANKTIYAYLGFNQQGWNEHATHAAIGSYARHLVPFWESKHVGWKLWFPTSVDVYAKRKGQLMSQRLLMENLDGYSVPNDMGSDIQGVDDSFGGGGICVFEDPDQPDVASLPRFTPTAAAQGGNNFNAGQISDTRYAFDVVVNGPLRSMVRVRTMNWNTGAGSYEAEQLYTAYANQSYSTCRVKFTRFLPRQEGVMLGCGFRKKPTENKFFQQGGVAISAGPERVVNPDERGAVRGIDVDFIGSALVVKDEDHPQYVFVPDRLGNYAFRVPPGEDHAFEYMISSAWSEGEVLKDYETYKDYILKEAQGINQPVQVTPSLVQARP